MTRSLTLLASITLCAAPAFAQGESGEAAAKKDLLVRRQLSDQVEDLLRGIRDGKTEEAQGILAGWKPTEAALNHALTKEGKEKLSKAILGAAEETFAGTPAEVGERLGLDVKKLVVTVYQSSTEGLQGMSEGSIAALHFASALRSTSRLFKPHTVFYSVSMLERDAPEDATGSYLQIFVRHGETFVYLGRVWRFDQPETSDEDEDE